MEPPDDPDCYWVEPDRLLAGEYPGSDDEDTARAKLNALLDCGVRTFVDLTEKHDLLDPYDAVLQSEASERGLTVAYHRKPVKDMNVPSILHMRDILAVIKASVDRGDAVYVHCYGGIGRTGTVVGCWLVERGTGGDDPIAAIAELRADVWKLRRPSPETDAQITFVRDWPAR